MPLDNYLPKRSAFACSIFSSWPRAPQREPSRLGKPPWFYFFPPLFFYYKSMIEIVCDNRHSNWAGHNDMRARNKLNTIYKSQKWQGLQESVKEERMEGRRCACVCMCARASMCVCVCFLTPKLLMTSVFLQSKHSPTPNTIQLSNPAPPLNSRAF